MLANHRLINTGCAEHTHRNADRESAVSPLSLLVQSDGLVL
ncbi:Uncharacterised protein [Vibrio cholerae]|nr:Uncharacterised protein [Vibrio cholerae]